MDVVQFDFVKCHGSGNDFPLIDARALDLSAAEWAAVARALADRRGPVGGDGLLLLGQGAENHQFSMVMLNSDGSEAETCLNGLRCVARLGFEALGVDAAGVQLNGSVATAARDPDVAPGVYTVRETAGPVSLDVAAWPLRVGQARIVDAVVPGLGAHRFTAVAIPNPHLVTFVDTIDEAELVRVGTLCEAAPDWLPNRANVSFVTVKADAIFVRTFERGVGLTDSCGSAMAASTYAACLTGRIAYDTQTTVFNKGGLVRAQASAAAMVTLSGNATVEWTGSVTVDLDPGEPGARDLVIARRHDEEIAAWETLRTGM